MAVVNLVMGYQLVKASLAFDAPQQPNQFSTATYQPLSSVPRTCRIIHQK